MFNKFKWRVTNMEEIFDVLDENANYLNYTATRSEVHNKGLWHRAVVVFIINSKNEILLQRRSATKRTWAGLLDVSIGGHCNAGEFGYESALREAEEELGLKLKLEQLLFIGLSRSQKVVGDITDNMFNEYYVANTNVDISKLNLQQEEVSEVKFVTKNELEKMMETMEGLTPKKDAFEAILKYVSKENK